MTSLAQLLLLFPGVRMRRLRVIVVINFWVIAPCNLKERSRATLHMYRNVNKPYDYAGKMFCSVVYSLMSVPQVINH